MVRWQTALCRFTVDCETNCLEEMRIAAINGLYAIPHGGVEVGGVLFGAHSAGRIHVAAHRMMETEYLTGPSFHPSANDKAALRKLLQETNLQPVGWFHSHTRSGIHLSPEDLATYNEFFPEPWQVALVLRPEDLGPVRGGYFFREVDGRVQSDASVKEFTLQPAYGEDGMEGGAALVQGGFEGEGRSWLAGLWAGLFRR